jgi:hypothetical protein
MPTRHDGCMAKSTRTALGKQRATVARQKRQSS